MVLIYQLSDIFWQYLTTEEFPNHIFYFNKRETSKIKTIDYPFKVSGVKLTSIDSLIDLSNLKELSKKTTLIILIFNLFR